MAPPELAATWQDDAADGMAGYADNAETIKFMITVRKWEVTRKMGNIVGLEANN